MNIYKLALTTCITLAILVSLNFLVIFEFEVHGFMPVPGDTRVLQKGEDESEEQARREIWIEQIHKAAPGVNWREIENQNRKERYSRFLNRSKPKDGSTLISVGNNLLQGVWTEKGSANLSGRTHTADYDTSSGKIYLASSGGNIWKGNLNGTGWEVLNDQLQFSSIELVRVLNRNKTHRILAASNSKTIYYTDDEGGSWQESVGFGSFSGGGEGLIRTQVRDDSAATVYALVAERIPPSTQRVHSLYKSTDLGSNFERVLSFPSSGGLQGSLADMWIPQYGISDVYFISNFNTYRYSVAGDSLIQTGSFPGNASGYSILTGHLGSNQTYLYAYVGGEIYRSVNAGINWEFRINLNQSPFFKTSFSASVATPDKLFFGDIECSRSVNGGLGWTKINDWPDYYENIVSKLHADIPSVNCLLDENGDEFYLINTDGGVYRSPDGFQVANISLQDLNISQYYSSLTSQIDTNFVFLGSQDQGFQRAYPDDGGLLYPEQVVSGDYGHIVSSGQGSSIWMVYPGFAIFYPDATGFSDLTWDFDGNNTFWIPPLMPDPNLEQVAYMANGNRITRLSQSGNSISAANLPTIFQGAVSAIASSPINPDYWYVYTDNGRFYKSINAGETWTSISISNSPSGNYLYGACIYPSRYTLGEVWISGSGYSNPPVYFSNNNGESFTAKSEGLPSTLAFRLAGTPGDEFIFAATESGPYVYVKEANEWFELSEGIAPDQTYWSVEYIDEMKVARFVTYGRGAWDFRIQNVLSINESEKAEVAIYPQPASENLSIRTDLMQGFDYSLFSINGQLIQRGKSAGSSINLDVASLPSSVYIIRIESGSQISTRKVVVSH
ncbi:MAG: T9SS type A sorting domain-containing protein [Bacteroidia bacterium]